MRNIVRSTRQCERPPGDGPAFEEDLRVGAILGAAAADVDDRKVADEGGVGERMGF